MFMGALSSVQCLFLHYKHILNIRSLNNSLSGSIAHICCASFSLSWGYLSFKAESTHLKYFY